MQPIATYEERLPHRRYRFELFSDAIYVRGSTPQTDVETTIPLVQLHPSIMRVWSYSPRFYIGYWLFLVGIVLLLVVVGVVMAQDPRSFPAKPLEFAGGLATMGMALVILNRHKTEYAQFRSDAGIPILGIARGGKGSGDFDQFVALLEKQVRIARGEAGIRDTSTHLGAIDAFYEAADVKPD